MLNPKLAPIVVFAYKRPEHLARMLTSLAQCSLAGQSQVFIYCDGPKSPSDLESVLKTREVARLALGFGQVHVLEKQKNIGLSKSVVSGVGEICERYGRVIVLEDDLEVAPHFLEYMNTALEKYSDEPRVMEVSGYMYPVKTEGPYDAFFMKHASCWGWGTWQRAWKKFRFDPKLFEQLTKDRRLRHHFDIDGTYPYYRMINEQLKSQIDSWGVIWYMSIFSENGLILMPRKTMVKNIGQDGSGTHVAGKTFDDHLENVIITDFPPVEEDKKAYIAFQALIKKKYVPWYKRPLKTKWLYLG